MIQKQKTNAGALEATEADGQKTGEQEEANMTRTITNTKCKQ